MKNARAKRAKLLFFIVKYAHWGFCCRRRRGCLSSLLKTFSFFSQASHSEKPSITTLTSTLAEKMVKKYDTVAISRTVSENDIALASN